MKKTNVLMIVADDLGISDIGCYGGELSTPNLDALGRSGLRFTQHYSAGRCWPSRACLLTGQYYQQVPQHSPEGPLPDWGRTIPHYLKPKGYRCYHTGKWHVNQVPTIIKHGGFDRSYYIRDYDRNFAVRDHQLDDQPLPPADPSSGYYSSTAIAGYGLDFLNEHEKDHADKPFFLYVGFIAPHFPLHAPREDIDFYRGRYDAGWDQLREERLQRLRAEGLVSCELSPRQPKVKPAWNFTPAQLNEQIGPGEASNACAWDELTDEQKRFQAQKMEIHAAMIHRMDREIGRLTDKLKAMGEYDNTVILFVSDNGASAEQIIRGDGHDKSATPGTEESYLCLGPGWSTNCNTPFRYHKSWVHEGGIASPLIVHWPAGIPASGDDVKHRATSSIYCRPCLISAVPTPYPSGAIQTRHRCQASACCRCLTKTERYRAISFSSATSGTEPSASATGSWWHSRTDLGNSTIWRPTALNFTIWPINSQEK